MASITIRAFAKINLSLRFTGVERPDGFHDLRTILQSIDLSDRVVCESRRGPFTIRCDMAGVPTDSTNLVWKAARVLWEKARLTGEPRNTMVSLQKRIPMQAGLGGGSSDAAAALQGLRRLWKLRVPDEELYRIAAELGSDVPFFLVGGTALGLGRGEEVYPLANLPAYWVVIAMPPFGVETRDAYKWLDEGRWIADVSYLPATWLGRTTPLGNDLEGPVIARHPMIGALKARLREQGALMAAMSGSGSAVFGVFKSGVIAKRAARVLANEGTRVLRARFRGRPCP
jgi:4-diphosphocytidyl-2-C-methyl-D-erythritol kinase